MRRKQPIPLGIVLLGASALGGAVFLFYRAATAASLPLQVTPLPPGVTGTSLGSSGPSPSPVLRRDADGSLMIPLATEQLLRANEEAREIFALQALLYSFGATTAPPDGVAGPVTNSLIAAYSGTPPETNYQFDTLALVRQRLQTMLPGALHYLPWRMPQDVIDAVNQSNAALDSMAIPLQVTASNGVGPAGRARRALPRKILQPAG